MKVKSLIYFLPVMLISILSYGFSTQDNPSTTLSSTPEFIQSMSANPPVMPFAIGDSCSGAGQEKHDDGSFENGGGWNATVTDGRIVSLFTPASYPWKYNKFCVALTRLATGGVDLNFVIEIYDNTGAGGTPGTLLGTSPSLTASAILVYPAYSWHSYDISALAGNLVNSGSIYIGLKYDAAPTSQAGKFIMIDESAGTPLWPSYYFANVAPWVTAQTAWPLYKSWGMRTIGQTPMAPVGNTLVLVHDTTATSTVQRKADRDTLNKYLAGFVGSYTMMGFDTSTVLPDLTPYNSLIIQETSFDAANLRYLGVGARNQIKTWLASGTVSSKKSLIWIGGDLGWNYSRATSPGQDLVFAETYGKFIYRLDNGSGTTAPSLTGVTIDAGNVRLLNSTPPGGSYWPDGCSMVAGGSSALYRYQNHTSADTLGGIGNVQPGYVVASLFIDPRYPTSDFKQIFGATVSWVKANGGLITNTGNNSALSIADNFTLAQNYPNPFNPTTTINYSIPKSGLVSLKVFDILGKEVASLVNGEVTAGSHTVNFNASFLSSGVYFYRIESGNFVDTKKMFLLK